MEMCYDGALVMPSNYVVVDEDEMCYVEGGKAWSVSKGAKYINVGVSAILAVAGIGFGVSSILWFLKNSVRGLVVAGLKRAIISVAAAIGFSVASGLYGILGSINGKWTIGYGIAKLIDKKDKHPNNGLLFA